MSIESESSLSFLQSLGYRIRRRFLMMAIGLLESAEDSYVTWHGRPRRTDCIDTALWNDPAINQCGIVMQGQIILEDDFTFQTLQLYRKHYPSIPILLSTWESEDPSQVKRIRDLGVEVMLNSAPAKPGRQNINLQIVSSSNGINHLKQKNVKYILKTRSDQRLYDPTSLGFLLRNCLAFSLRSDITNQTHRLIGVSLNTFVFRPYGLSDMLMFGAAQDMLRYWSPPLCEISVGVLPANNTLIAFSRSRLCEVYLCTEFLEATGHALKWTLADSLEVFADRFLIVDANALDLYWRKYSPHCEHRRKCYDVPHTDIPVSYSIWLTLYQNRAMPPTSAESILDQTFTSIIGDSALHQKECCTSP